MSSIVAALVAVVVLGLGVVVNEATHGAIAEAVGVGHHHMFDYGQQHCASGSVHDRGLHDNDTHRHSEACAPSRGGPHD